MQQITSIDVLSRQSSKEELYNKEKEFTSIFEAYYKRVYNYIYYRVRCYYTAEDLTSQVFEKIMLKIDTYSEKKSPFEVWLFAIARNTVNDYFRSSQKHTFISIDTIKELISRKKNPEDMVAISETNEELFKALTILNKKERNIIELKFGAELKNKEIAEILNITEGNVGIILYRTMKKLNKELKKEEN
ncbi:ECF subfamily RNA polymerase sigma factor, BldN family [Tissierella pigra]|uniref:ECF subfamily RNA polymerase sigma factor, BldN family n=1 Tax=Tissierella pigra TaxID=2607614 RepID=UPI002DDC6690|nr:ECF subfamily RNA polymerase sigma factor, BldN family [Tissierella pigra]